MTATAAAGTQHRVDVDGATISYLRAGAGAPMLFLHGAGGIEGWAPWMDALAASYDLIVPDHPGWGRSDTPDWYDNIHDLAYFYLDFIEALGLENVHLVGNSLGGWIACEMAIRTTKHITTMTLVDPAGLRVPGVQRFDIFLASREANIRAAFYDRALAERVIALAPEGDALDRFLKNRFATARAGWQPRLYDPHLAKWLHRVDIPTLVMWGQYDGVFPVAMIDEFLRLIPGSTGAIIPDCGHLPHVECTDAFVAQLNAFITGAHA
jgi:pimeloyl-ACP methyl ester carboxylesterase